MALHLTDILRPLSHNFHIKNWPQNSDRVQFRFQSHKQRIIKPLKTAELHPTEFLRTEMTSNPSNYQREYSWNGSYSLFQFEGSDVISVLKHISVFFTKCFVVSVR